ncbi:MAG: septum formation initiator family protein [Deltaproteobacteria bacterium]|nr:septum formation initiator family protein [Deltaproteobacteria bacterium]
MRVFDFFQNKYLAYLIIFVSAMVVFGVFGVRGLMNIYYLRGEREKVRTVNARLSEENRRLAEQINRLRHNKEEVEKIAREELGLAKKGEIVYQFEK